MVFSSLEFLFFYLPITLLITKLSPIKYRNFVLFFVSLVFYGWSEPYYILIMLLSTFVDYFNGLMVAKALPDKAKAKRYVIFSIVFNLGLLSFFKYTDFIIQSLNSIFNTSIPVLGIVLPVGISFYTFQTMSYPIDVYRGDAEPQRSMIDFGAYVAMFPQLIAGPIVRYKDVAEQLVHRDETAEKFANGIKRFCLGLFKKVFLANNLGSLFNTLLTTTFHQSMSSSWLALIAYAMQIYFDFSGYSDMAIGLGKIIGFELLENFNYPYISKSITEFWRRWHISLGSWFRDYLYIPLGGNRGGTIKAIRNLIIVWFLTGLWHGASWNFVLWGLYFCFILILEKYVLKKTLTKLPNALQHTYALFFILIGWMVFAFEDLAEIEMFLKSLFNFTNFYNGDILFILNEYKWFLVISILACTPLFKKFYIKLPEKMREPLSIILVALSLIICTSYLVADSYNPFLYFRF